jgi:DNA primase catalytic core
MIEREILERIKNTVNIVDVIGGFVTLHKKGVNYWGLCPFHSDGHSSLCVSPSKQIFRCWACGASGDVFSFLEKHEGMSLPEAARYLGGKCGIDLPQGPPRGDEQARMKERESIFIALTAANRVFEQNLQVSEEAQNYLSLRGWEVDNAVLQQYHVGYAAPSWRELNQALQKKAFSKEVLLSGGLGKEGEKGMYDVFRNRIVFPYLDLRGNITGFTGRSLVPGEKSPKYLNTDDTPVFKKGSAVFGLYQARQAIGRMDKVYLVEGQFDVLSLVAAGVENTVCASGTALTSEQIKMLMRFTSNISLIYDTDQAGIKASVRNLKELLLAGANVRAVLLPAGDDPDSFARKNDREKFPALLFSLEQDWVTYLTNLYKSDFDDPVKKNEALGLIAERIAAVRDKSLKASYCAKLSELFHMDIDAVKDRIRGFNSHLPKSETEMKPGFYGLESLDEINFDMGADTCRLTNRFDVFCHQVGRSPVVYFSGIPSADQRQQLRRKVALLSYHDPEALSFDERGECDTLTLLCDLFRDGLTVYVGLKEDSGEIKSYEFVDYYLRLYAGEMDYKTGDIRTIYMERCAALISFASEASRATRSDEWRDILRLKAGAFKTLLKPHLDKRKSKYAIARQRSYDDTLLNEDPDVIPPYVEENEVYREMYRRHGFYPVLNRESEPVCYMFRNPNGSGHTQIADFYMTPLLHIYDTDSEYNKRVIRVNRRYYKQPVYLEIKSKALASMQSFEEVLLNEEALNFENGETRHFRKIRQAMSYQYITCNELRVYGQQPEDFFSFSNAIFHKEDGAYRVDMASELGVVTHKGLNYYLPAFSKIYANLRKDNDLYEQHRYFSYKEIPEGKRCSFDHWASLMNRVYRVNDNGKWALLYAIMCAFRSDIHLIDRLFTALFFIGPTMSGKTQIAISIRSLYIHPDSPAFNLNSGTDAAFFTLMEGFRDVPQILDEYNNHTISDAKFQGLKSITYDGDGKQKRKATGSRDIEVSKVNSPVIIMGQETPQKDDNALMNRVVILEVPKKETFTDAEREVFQELKEYEKNGLCNILLEIIKLRPLFREHFKRMQRNINRDLTSEVLGSGNKSGDTVRIINTVSLFLTTCRLVEEQVPSLKLPFSYREFFEIARRKVISQVEMISHTDKLSGFFKAMEVMINTRAVIAGRDYDIDQPARLTLRMTGNEQKEIDLPAQTKVLYIRLSPIHTLYARSSYNTEGATLSTIEANIRSNPAYIGFVRARRFKWKEVAEVPKGDPKGEGGVNMDMVRRIENRTIITTCLALNYEEFRRYFDIDLEREADEADNRDEFGLEGATLIQEKANDIPF